MMNYVYDLNIVEKAPRKHYNPNMEVTKLGMSNSYAGTPQKLSNLEHTYRFCTIPDSMYHWYVIR